MTMQPRRFYNPSVKVTSSATSGSRKSIIAPTPRENRNADITEESNSLHYSRLVEVKGHQEQELQESLSALDLKMQLLQSSLNSVIEM